MSDAPLPKVTSFFNANVFEAAKFFAEWTAAHNRLFHAVSEVARAYYTLRDVDRPRPEIVQGHLDQWFFFEEGDRVLVRCEFSDQQFEESFYVDIPLSHFRETLLGEDPIWAVEARAEGEQNRTRREQEARAEAVKWAIPDFMNLPPSIQEKKERELLATLKARYPDADQ